MCIYLFIKDFTSLHFKRDAFFMYNIEPWQCYDWTSLIFWRGYFSATMFVDTMTSVLRCLYILLYKTIKLWSGDTYSHGEHDSKQGQELNNPCWMSPILLLSCQGNLYHIPLTWMCSYARLVKKGFFNCVYDLMYIALCHLRQVAKNTIPSIVLHWYKNVRWFIYWKESWKE